VGCIALCTGGIARLVKVPREFPDLFAVARVVSIGVRYRLAMAGLEQPMSAIVVSVGTSKRRSSSGVRRCVPGVTKPRCASRPKPEGFPTRGQ